MITSTDRQPTKTQTPVDYASAKKIYDKLVKSKTLKGYAPGAQGPQYVNTDTDARETGVRCQLLNCIEVSKVTQYIHDDDWWAQEKYDGKRMFLRKTDTVTAINRNGLTVGAPDVIIKPTYIGVRDDVGAENCVISQLKYKKDVE